MESIRQYFRRTDKIYLLLCVFSSVMACVALSSWAAKQGNGFADEAVEPLAGVIFAYLDLFHVTHHLHATIIADFQRIVNTNSC